MSEANEDVSDDLTIPAGRWEASDELSSFLDVMFADKPLSVYDRKQITKDFPRPNVESVFTPVLDDYLGSLVTGAKGVDKEAKKFQDQLLDIVGPVSMAFEHVSNWHESEDNPGSVILCTQDVDGLYTCLSKALTLLGSVNAQYKVHRRKQVLDKLNPQMSSLASEPFPEAGKNLFGPSFEEKVKKRNETVKILSKAAPKKPNMQFFRRQRDLLPIQARAMGVSFLENGPITYQASQPEGEAHISGAGAGAGEGSQLLNQVRTMFHPKVPSSSCKPSKCRYATIKREFKPSISKVIFKQFRPFFNRGQPLTHSRSFTTLHRKLASSYKRPLGAYSYFRVSYSLYNHTTPRFSSLSQSIGGGRKFDRQRTRRVYSKTGNPSGFRTRVQHGICQQPVCNPQKGRRTKTSLQPPPIKSIYPIRTFQNGGHTYAQRPTETKRFHGEDRFERCLLYCSNLERSPKIPPVSLEGYPVGVCMPPIWNSKCPQGLYQDSETGNRPVKKARNSSDHLFRRFFTDGLHRRNSNIPCFFFIDSHPSRDVRVCGQLPKIPAKSYTVNRVSGFPYKFSYTKHQPSLGKSRHHDKGASSTPRETKCFDPGSVPSTPSLSLHPSSQKAQSNSSWGLRVPSMLDRGSPRRTKMVERPPFCLERESNFTNPSSLDNRNRCFHNGMGSMLWKPPDQRALVSVRKTTTHKLFRTSSRRFCPKVISKKQVQHPCKVNDGQYNSNKLYKQNGRANITGLVKPSLRPLAVVSRTVYYSRSSPLAGATKHCGRFRILSSSRFQRLATGTIHLSGYQQQMGPLHNRSFCKQTDNATTQVCELEARSRGRGSGCLYSGLEPAQGIRIPSICPDRAVSKASSATVSLSVDNCDSSVGNPTMVPIVLRNDNRQSHIAPIVPRATETRERVTPSCSPSTSRMASLRSRYQGTTVSLPAQRLLLAAWRTRTEKTYSSALRKWTCWCREQQVNPLSASLDSVLYFLASQFEAGLEYRTLNVYHSALSATHPQIEGYNVGEHPLVVQLLKGIFNSRPPVPRYTST